MLMTTVKTRLFLEFFIGDTKLLRFAVEWPSGIESTLIDFAAVAISLRNFLNIFLEFSVTPYLRPLSKSLTALLPENFQRGYTRKTPTPKEGYGVRSG